MAKSELNSTTMEQGEKYTAGVATDGTSEDLHKGYSAASHGDIDHTTGRRELVDSSARRSNNDHIRTCLSVATKRVGEWPAGTKRDRASIQPLFDHGDGHLCPGYHTSDGLGSRVDHRALSSSNLHGSIHPGRSLSVVASQEETAADHG